jgi:hypothetical protein
MMMMVMVVMMMMMMMINIIIIILSYLRAFVRTNNEGIYPFPTVLML